jgi:hypothetical protein
MSNISAQEQQQPQELIQEEQEISVERFLFGESSKELQAKAFFLQIKENDPELFKDLERQAMLAINGIRSRQKPKTKVGVLKILFAWNPELDPTKSADTYGVRAFISSLAANKQEAGKAKRFYDRTIDAFFKQLFSKASEEVAKKEKLSGNIAKQQKSKSTTLPTTLSKQQQQS